MKSTIIIPARWASKRFPGKPLAKIKKKELIHHVWDRAKLSKEADLCLVATDDKRIKSVAIKYGAEVPFIRPKKLSQDHVLDYPVILHAIKKLNLIYNQ